MEDLVLSVNTFPEQLHHRFRSSRVRVHEENGVVTLTPVSEQNRDNTENLEQIRLRRETAFGSLKGKVWMSADFDDPIEEMREYME